MLNLNVAASPGRTPPRLRARLRQRGMSLVELAIVLAVVGIILGGSLIPLYQKRAQEDVDRTQRRLDDIHAAIAGYAIRHRTPGVRYVVNVQEYGSRDADTSGMPVRSIQHVYWIPANRPYLPCPDYSGDGVEDRLSQQNWFLSQTLLQFLADAKPVNPSLARRNSYYVDYPFQAETDLVYDLFDRNSSNVSAQNSLAHYGVCGNNAYDENTDRGALPWRTLGVPPADKWGTRFTYRVDQVYASALTGFGQEMRTDSYDPRIPMFHTTSRGRRLMPLRTFWNPDDIYEPLPHNSMLPSLVCGDTRDDEGTEVAVDESDLVCEPLPFRASDPLKELTDPEIAGLLAGAVVTEGKKTGWTVDNVRPVPFPEDGSGATEGAVATAQYGGITEGAPYVVVSHGPNRSFGFNHRTIRNEQPSMTDPHPCRWQDANTDFYTARNGFMINSSRASPGEAHNSPCPVDLPSGFSRGRHLPYLFYSQPVASSAVSRTQAGYSTVFDDIVEWRSRPQINGVMAASGVYPVEPMPLLVTR